MINVHRVCLAMCIALLSLGAMPVNVKAADRSTIVVPFEYVDNRIIVESYLDGRGPFSFVLDTGADGVVITPELAKRLNLSTQQAGQTTGVGNKTAAAANVTIPRIDVGHLNLRNTAALVVDLSQIRQNIGFTRLDGILGRPILSAEPVTIDIDHKRLIFGNPTPPAGAKVFHFDGVLPEVRGAINGIPATIVVDTGDRSSLTLFQHFENAHHVYTPSASLQNIVTGFGIGGAVYGDVFRIRDVEIFSTHLDGVVTRASRQHAGVFATALQAGSVGGGVLRHFNLLFDYSKSTVAVWPSKQSGDHDLYDQAGMWLSEGSDGLPIVTSIVPGAPAAHASIHIQDAILAVNGTSTKKWTIPELRALLATEPPGTELHLRLLAAGKQRSTTLILRRLL